jgi:hypothetical protein
VTDAAHTATTTPAPATHDTTHIDHILHHG